MNKQCLLIFWIWLITLTSVCTLLVHCRKDQLDNRLSNLALIAVERELSDKLLQDPSEVIDMFASFPGKLRRLDLKLS